MGTALFPRIHVTLLKGVQEILRANFLASSVGCFLHFVLFLFVVMLLLFVFLWCAGCWPGCWSCCWSCSCAGCWPGCWPGCWAWLLCWLLAWLLSLYCLLYYYLGVHCVFYNGFNVFALFYFLHGFIWTYSVLNLLLYDSYVGVYVVSILFQNVFLLAFIFS